MKIIKIATKLSKEEKEVHVLCDAVNNRWLMDTTWMRFYKKAKKQGWPQVCEYVYEDGTVCGGVFEAPIYAITIRSAVKKQMTDKQMHNLDDTDDDEL